jgi:hypothetical protein
MKILYNQVIFTKTDNKVIPCSQVMKGELLMKIHCVEKKMKILMCFFTLVVLIVLSVGCSQDRFQDGLYINEKYDFSLTIPEHWRSVSEEEAIKCPTLRVLSGLDNRLMITPSNPDDTGMIVSVLPITEEQFNAMPWSQYTRTLRSIGNMVIEDDTLEDIGGFDVHWVSGNAPLAHNGVALFISNGKVMQIFYWIKKPVEEEIMIDAENIVLSLQKVP